MSENRLVQVDSVEQLKKDFPPEQPLFMLNLLRYREQAQFEAGIAEPRCSGLEAYRRYVAAGFPLVQAEYGELVFSGRAVGHPIAPDAERWHDMVLVKWPRLENFLGFTEHPDYLAIVYLRTAALADSRLIAFSDGADFVAG